MMRLQMIDGTAIHSDNKITIGSRIHGSGAVTRTFNHPDDGPLLPAKTMCRGCHEDFYNHGSNGFGGKGCWSFATAVVCNKVGYSSIHVANGPDTKMEKTLTCWRGVCK